MIPGKKYTPEDLVEIALRRKWLIIVPFVVVAIATAVVAQLSPNLYRSETVILVVPQRIPESYVRSTVTNRIEDRLQTLREQILSRTRLERVILDFNLYADARRTAVMENVVEMMRRDIIVEIVKGDAFKVSYVSSDPQAAMKVADRLASLFIDENRRDREVLADGTNQFLESQLEDARRRLAEQEKKVEEYRRRYAGELPSQVDSNLHVVQNTQLQLQGLSESIDRDRDRRLVLERSIADLTAVEPTTTATIGDQPSAPKIVLPLSDVPDEVEIARRKVAELRARLTPQHPDVIRATRALEELEAKTPPPTVATTQPGTKPAPPPAARPRSSADIARAARVQNLQIELQTLDRQIATKEAEQRQLRADMQTYQARVEAAPTRESELIELTRDYTTLQQVYTNLLSKREDSKVAANLERRQAGEQFRVLDPARLPERPFSPDRLRMNLLGAVAGLGFGLGLAAFLEYRDTTLRTDDDVLMTVSLPVLAMIPMMVTTADRRRQMRNRWLAAAAAAAGLAVGTAAIAWKAAGL